MKNPGSGAIATKRMDNLFTFGKLKDYHPAMIDLRNDTDYAVGDIAPLTNADAYDFLRLFAVECKNYTDIPWNQLFFFPQKTTSTHIIYQHWKKHVEDCKVYYRVPLLIYRESQVRAPHPVIIVPESFVETIPGSHKLIKLARAWIPHFQVYIFGMEDFFNPDNITYLNLVNDQTFNWIVKKLPDLTPLKDFNTQKKTFFFF
jgi:hypothetical protein